MKTRPAAKKRSPAKRSSRTRAKASSAKNAKQTKVESRTKTHASAMEDAVLINLQAWFDGLEAQKKDEPIVGTARGMTITPRVLIKHVKRKTALGRGYVASFNDLALKHVMSKMSQS